MAENQLLIRGGEAFIDGRLVPVNIAIANGRIVGAGPEEPPATRILEAQGRWILPGMIDTHVHFREPGRTDKEDFRSGTMAAAAGGVTCVLEIQNNEPLTTTPEALLEKHSLVGKKSLVRFGLYANVGRENLDLLDALAERAIAFKVFMTQSVGPLTVTSLGDLWRTFEAVRRTGKVLAVHAESDPICKEARLGLEDETSSHVRARPALAEWVAVAEALELCAATGARLNLAHLSTGRAVELVRDAKARGLPVSAATCPHYLVFDDEDVARGGNVFKVNPSIKRRADREALREGLREGIIDHVHSDHAPHTSEEKARPFSQAPSGIAGIQHQLLVLLELAREGILMLGDVVRATASAPAFAFDLQELGRLAPGYHADLVVIDPHQETVVTKKELLSRAATSPWLGHRFPFRVAATVVAGNVVYENGRVIDNAPSGPPL